MMPALGGYYHWVKHALGLRWAFYEGWWSWLCTFIDLAIYPQLFVLYATALHSNLAHYQIPVCLAIIWICAGFNILGIVRVGKTSAFLSVMVLLPFIALIIVGIAHSAGSTTITDHATHPVYWGMAVFTIVWNFVGWDNVTTYANEVDRPTRAYLKAIRIAFVSIYLLYLGVVWVAHSSAVNTAALSTNGFPVLGQLIAGKWLATSLAIGGMISTVGMFLAVLLSISRIPEAMAADKILPTRLQRLHPRYGTPTLSIIICALLVSLLIWLSFGELLIIDITVYFAGLLLEFAALIKLRRIEPQAHRPFRIPVHTGWLYIIVSLPIIIYIIALADIAIKSESIVKPFSIAIAMLLSAAVVWRVVRWRNREIKN